jgi:hypothetical protein
MKQIFFVCCFIGLGITGFKFPVPKDSRYYTWLSAGSGSNSIEQRIAPPAGFSRVQADTSGFEYWVRGLPLKPGKPAVYLHNGNMKSRQDVHVAVVDMDVGTEDLQQCADALMRVRAEFLYSRKKFDKITFNYTSGHPIPFSRWAAGERPVVSGNKVSWKSGGKSGTAYPNFKSYLGNVFMYAGSLSLAKELKPASLDKIKPGDVFLIGGSPGHGVMVVDVVKNAKGELAFLLAQSYMPAQEFHVLKNPKGNGSPWYFVSDCKGKFQTPEWDFSGSDLKTW